jgi:hypothetical protein
MPGGAASKVGVEHGGKEFSKDEMISWRLVLRVQIELHHTHFIHFLLLAFVQVFSNRHGVLIGQGLHFDALALGFNEALFHGEQ